MGNPAVTSFDQFTPEGILTLGLASAIGRFQLWKMTIAGLPVCLGGPLRFLVERSLEATDLKVVRTIEGFRADMAKRSGEFVEVFTDNTSADEADFNRTGLRSLAEVARISSVQPYWGAFLYLCAKASRAKTILELGGAAGISGCYLAASPSCGRFVTIEGSPSRAQLAKCHLQLVTSSAEVIIESFEKGLDDILPTLKSGLDLVFFDGSKQQEELLALFDRLKPFLNPRCLLIFDDIYWSAEMRDAWKHIGHLQGLQHAINVGRMGVCVWEGGEGHARNDMLFGLMGLDLYGARYRILSLASTLFLCPWGKGGG
jgi:predicted O-methyltransferase YrrM